MSKRYDITGERFGSLVASEYVGRQNHVATWLCVCDCSEQREVRLDRLKSGEIFACKDCMISTRSERVSVAHSTHGHWRGGKATKTYDAWKSMRKRCYDKKYKNYQHYGGRGITVCDRWLNSFENFLEDMGEPPDGLSLDRIDPNGNYRPDNCRWASPREQARNRRTTKFIEFGGKSQLLCDWASEVGITPEALSIRIKKWGLQRALTTPPRKSVALEYSEKLA
jgi:hypothetical protein